MQFTNSRPERRKGIIAPLTGILMIFLVGMIAFAVDMGWVVLAQAELQNAADAAALAGAEPLMDGYVKYHLPNQSAAEKSQIITSTLASARSRAKEYAAYNNAGGVSVTLPDTDIEFGFTNAAGSYTATPGPSYTNFPNTIRVTTRRDSSSNGSLKLFFAPAIGTERINLTARAGATIYGGVITSFNPGNNLSTGMLPVTFDYFIWNDFMRNGKDGSGTISVDVDGNAQIEIFSEHRDKGNFGWLALDDTHDGTNELIGYVDNGLPPSDIRSLVEKGLLPATPNDAPTFDWLGNPGYRSSAVQAVNEYVGKSFLIPLFRPKTTSPYKPGENQGSKYNYDIVAFVGIKIMQAQDDNKQIIVQPCAVIDPNAIYSTVTPAGSDPSNLQITTFTTPKLTR